MRWFELLEEAPMSDRPVPDHRSLSLDELLANWPYEFGEVVARLETGDDKREVLQLRIDMGVLQMETTGRPDGQSPGGHPTYYDQLFALLTEEGEEFELDETRCIEIDREFMQFYHRRIAWLALADFSRAIADAEHTLALMDFSSLHAPSVEWADMHEQYRPFVLFHRAQAAALAALEDLKPEQAVKELDEGAKQLYAAYQALEECFEVDEEEQEDEYMNRLYEMKASIENQYEIEPPLAKQLAEAVAGEQYELAAELRDRIARKSRRSSESGSIRPPASDGPSL